MINTSRWQKLLSTDRNEHTRTSSPKCVTVDRGRKRNEAEGCVAVEPLEPFLETAVEEIVQSEMENLVIRKLRQGRTKNNAKVSHYRRVFCGDQMLEYPVLKEPELTARKTVLWEAVSKKRQDLTRLNEREMLSLRERWRLLIGSQPLQ